jgi:FRG domain
MKSIPELLEIECALYDDFRRCGAQLCNERIEEADQDWDWYFLMQHHNAPTRLLYWSDGALIALHFALRNKTKDALRDETTKSHCHPSVYVLDPDRLDTFVSETESAKKRWEEHLERRRFL